MNRRAGNRWEWIVFQARCLAIPFLAVFCVAVDAASAEMRVATFQCDVTPPLGSMTLRHQVLVTVETPLLAKGILLEDEQNRYIICALDWCLVDGTVHSMFRDKMAAAAGTDSSRVAVQCVHQHTAPWGAADVQRLIDQTEDPFIHSDVEFIEAVADRLATAVKEAAGRLEPFDSVGTGQAKVERVASSRRIIVNGKRYWRGGSAKNAKLRALPEGHIDPMLKTVTLVRQDKPLVRLHYYATHPQSFYGDPRASSDVPGFARERLQRKENVVQIYFTGCAGDVAMGKYNDRSRAARNRLTQRMLDAMEASIASTQLVPVERLQWRTVPLLLPLRTDRGYTVAENRKRLADPKLSKVARMQAARRVAFAQRADVPIELSCLSIGPVRILHLPGEPVVEFQLFAQRVMAKGFVAVAGLGDWSPGYLCTEKAFSEGGYEPSVSMVAPHGETVLKKAISEAPGAR